MAVLQAKMPALCLLLLMALLLFPGSEGKTCSEVSRTYTPLLCGDDTCATHCHKEGFPGSKLLCCICCDEQINIEFTQGNITKLVLDVLDSLKEPSS
uniref:Uncharacterized protein n=1 Tax=Aegilops tauschii TaxID=37682 RepID=R7W412_AEGTA